MFGTLFVICCLMAMGEQIWQVRRSGLPRRPTGGLAAAAQEGAGGHACLPHRSHRLTRSPAPPRLTPQRANVRNSWYLGYTGRYPDLWPGFAGWVIGVSAGDSQALSTQGHKNTTLHLYASHCTAADLRLATQPERV